MRTAAGNAQRIAIDAGQIKAAPLPKRRTALAQVHHHIVHPSADHANQLNLWIVGLKVQPANHIFRRMGKEQLTTAEGNPVLLKNAFLKAFDKNTAVVL